MRWRCLGLASAVAGLLLAGGAAAEAATLIGRLVNKTPGGQGVGGIEVTLTENREGRESGKRAARTDAQGRFRFADLSAGVGLSYGLSVNYQRGEYLAGPVASDAKSADRAIEIPVYDATTDPRALGVKLHHAIFDPAQDGFRVTEVLVVRNAGDRTYVGDRELGDGRRATLRFTLPAGSTDIKCGDGLMDCCSVPTEAGFTDTMDVKPGERQVAFTYILGGGSAVQFVRPLDYPTQAVELFVPERTRIASPSGLQTAGVATGENGRRYTRLTGVSLAPPARLAVTMEGLSGAGGHRWWLQAGAVLATLAGAAGLYPLVRWRRRQRPRGEPPMPADLRRIVRSAELRAALAALEEARATGKVTEEEYRRVATEKRRELNELETPVTEPGPPCGLRAGRRLWWAAAGLLILGDVGGFLLVGASGGLLGPSTPRLGVVPDLKDFGEVRRDAGKLEAVSTLRNEGKAPLRISRLVPT